MGMKHILYEKEREMREKWHEDMEDDSEKAMGVFRWIAVVLGIAVTISFYFLF